MMDTNFITAACRELYSIFCLHMSCLAFEQSRYVLLRPTLAVVAAILHIFGKYGDGIYSWDLYVSQLDVNIITNVLM